MTNSILIESVGYAAALLTLATYSMKTMIPLRALGISANCAFIAYAALAGIYPNLILHAVLLPLNVLRLRQMVTLVRQVETAAKGDLSMKWLQSFMSKRNYRAGEVVFNKDDESDAMFYVVKGRFRIPEIAKEMDPGDIVGEIGLVAPDSRRTMSFQCVEAGELLTITYSQLKQLYFQNPQFGFYFVKLISQRLFNDIARLENHPKSERTITTAAA
jgi:CRP/FNR family transcriptional regulator, cyclic AMP receptor protein